MLFFVPLLQAGGGSSVRLSSPRNCDDASMLLAVAVSFGQQVKDTFNWEGIREREYIGWEKTGTYLPHSLIMFCSGSIQKTPYGQKQHIQAV